MIKETNSFPKIIYSFWMQGRENAPEIIRINFDRWERLNPDYKVIILDKDSSRPYLEGFSFDVYTLTPQTISDILRLRLLAQTGGVWADAGMYPSVPLSHWLEHRMIEHSFFAFSGGRKDNHLSSSFLVARTDCNIIKKWHALMMRYWFMPRIAIHQEILGPKERPKIYVPENINQELGLPDMKPTTHYPYFWVHYLFGYLVFNDPDFVTEWKAIPDNSTYPGPIIFNHMYFGRRLPYGKNNRKNRIKWRICQFFFDYFKNPYLKWVLRRYPLHLLNWREPDYNLKLMRKLRV